MAKILITIDDADLSRVEDAVAGRYRRPEEIENPALDVNKKIDAANLLKVANPESKADFLKRWIVEHLQKTVQGFEQDEAKKAAISAAPPVDIT